jgi:Mo-co oxidoreductase dimerisation domain
MLKMNPINRMVPRSFVTNIASGSRVQAAAPTTLRGIAFGGDCGVASVDFSIDRGRSWRHQALETGPGSGSQRDDHNYKAPIAPEDVGTIIEYLAALKGAK